jgi:hypothetical protein
MSLILIQLWALVDLAGHLVLITPFLFPPGDQSCPQVSLPNSTYNTAAIAAGFVDFSLCSTPRNAPHDRPHSQVQHLLKDAYRAAAGVSSTLIC